VKVVSVVVAVAVLVVAVVEADLTVEVEVDLTVEVEAVDLEVVVEVKKIILPYFNKGRGGFGDDSDRAARKGTIVGFEGSKKKL
jgi:hypothetical protein